MMENEFLKEKQEILKSMSDTICLTKEDARHILEELEQYRSIGTVEECREARERQRAKKYERGIGKDVRCPVCGTCTTDIFEHRYCTYCGQRLE